MKENVDITIYLNMIKKYLDSNPPAAEYFFQEDKSNDFYNLLKIIAYENFEKTGEPELSIEQFEEIKRIIDLKNIFNKLCIGKNINFSAN